MEPSCSELEDAKIDYIGDRGGKARNESGAGAMGQGAPRGNRAGRPNRERHQEPDEKPFNKDHVVLSDSKIHWTPDSSKFSARGRLALVDALDPVTHCPLQVTDVRNQPNQAADFD